MCVENGVLIDGVALSTVSVVRKSKLISLGESSDSSRTSFVGGSGEFARSDVDVAFSIISGSSDGQTESAAERSLPTDACKSGSFSDDV